MRMQGLLAGTVVGVTAVLAGCSGGPDGGVTAATSASGTPAGTASSETAAASASGGTTSSLHPDGGARPEDWPAEAAPVHGASVWAVYLAVGQAGDPELADATEFLERHGYSAGVAELGCDQGAAEALGRDPQELAVAAYFDERTDADDFLAMLKPPGSTGETSRGFVELLRVTRGCLD